MVGWSCSRNKNFKGIMLRDCCGGMESREKNVRTKMGRRRGFFVGVGDSIGKHPGRKGRGFHQFWKEKEIRWRIGRKCFREEVQGLN